MELAFQKSPLQVLHRAVHEVRNQEQTLEIRLPEGMPDIGRVLGAWGQGILRGKEWRSGAIACNGGIMVWVLYAPEDGSDPRCVEGWLPYHVEWELKGEDREGDICAEPRLRFVDARSLSARKLMVRVGLSILGTAFIPGQKDIPVPGQLDPDIQLLKTTYPVRLWQEAGEKAFQLEEDLTMPQSAPIPEKLLYYTLQPEVTDCKVTGKRVACRGNANLHVLFRSEEGQLHTWDFEVPFAQLGDLNAEPGEDAQGQVTMAVTGLELQLDEEGRMHLKCGLLGQYLVSCRRMLELVEDAYSPRRRVTPQLEMLELPVLLDNRQETVYPEQTIHETGDIVVDTTFLPDQPRLRQEGDRAEVTMPGQFQMLFYGEDGVLRSAGARWEGTTGISAGENTQVEGALQSVNRPQAMMSSDGITLKTDARLDLQTISRQGMPMVTGLNVEEAAEPEQNRPSLILRRAGESRLWDLAKASGSTMEAIREANGFAGEPAPEQMLLIPVS